MTTLTIGDSVAQPGVPAHLDARRFNRHTFWCGQSGSGKTYALGVVLEQLMLHTELPIVIFDPNADFVRFAEPRAHASVAEQWSELDIRVFRSGSAGHAGHAESSGSAEGAEGAEGAGGARATEGAPLHVRYLDLSPAAKAAVLQIDPIADADEYNVLLHLEGEAIAFNAAQMVRDLRESDDPVRWRLANRIENLQVLEWDLWSRGAAAVVDVIDERPRATVLDLGGFDHPVEPKVAALGVLEHLWARRHERRPMLLVIDEAHNLCSPEPTTAVERALTERLIQIAAEGRKFGLWLFLSTQRPTKIHPNVLSQCDNLGLMRVNAPRDLAELSSVFGFASESAIHQAQGFTQGQGLFAGGFVDESMVVQMGERLTEEGGSDVRVPLKG